MPLIDALKALASQLIVLHHLALYGPLSDAVYTVQSALTDFLCDYARFAVQTFLVVAGFLAARVLAPHGKPAASRPMALIAGRYRRLAVPYLAAMACAVACAALARSLIQHDSIPAAPTLAQVIAHALMLQDVLGYEALSAGFWYVAIDFQLFALMVALVWLGQRLGPACGGSGRAATILISALGLASLLYFNRHDAWDSWGLYFFGAYALGALAYWSAGSRPAWLAALALAGVIVLATDFRARIAVALITALVLAIAARGRAGRRGASSAGVAFLARISYAVFLLHYPVSLVVNAAFDRLAPGNPLMAALGLVAAWAASIAAAALFNRYIERGAVPTQPRPVAA